MRDTEKFRVLIVDEGGCLQLPLCCVSLAQRYVALVSKARKRFLKIEVKWILF